MSEPEAPHASPPASPGRGRRILKWLARTAAVLAALVVLAAVAAGLWLRGRLAASLPPLDGERAVEGLAEPVRIARDALGVPTLTGANRRDVAFATGFVHGQDRFFQMDIFRRQAAGELAELLGPPLLGADRSLRRHRFRAVARQVLAQTQAERRDLLEAYAAGVNAGLASLGAPPFEYLVLRTSPASWKAEDSLLVLLVMFLVLQDDGDDETMQTLLHDQLPPALYEFLTPLGTPWDAPMTGEPFPLPAVPGPEAVELATTAGTRRRAPVSPPLSREAGLPVTEWASNAWAVAGHRSSDGGALLAIDTHTGLSVPNLWYRASFVWPADSAEPHRITGATLPGAPAMVVGSNGHVAWGFTNARIDASDLVLIELDPDDEDAYLSPEGPVPFEHHEEILRTPSGEEEVLDVVTTRWGPLVDEDYQGRPRALRWLPHEAEAVDLDFRLLEEARSVEDALAIGRSSGLPAQNLVLADSAGSIAWTIAGRLPRRLGLDGRLTVSWADGSHAWEGLLAPEEVPSVVDPPSGLVWTANNRVVDETTLSKLGTGGSYVLGARARQIRDRLEDLERATVEDMFRLQLDDRSLFLEPWRDLLLDVLTPEATEADPRRRELRRLVEAWKGHAAVDSVGHRLIREYRDALAEEVFEGLLTPCLEVDPELEYVEEFKQMEGPLWALVTQRPSHLLHPRYSSWNEQLLAAADAVLDRAKAEGTPLAERTWGRRNTSAIRHLFSPALPSFVGRRLDMPAEPLPGDRFMPRVQDPDTGAALRMVVSPGREEEGIFHMPAGQSGHFMSPHYRDSHGAWSRGEPTPFLPGEPVHTLVLSPSGG